MEAVALGDGGLQVSRQVSVGWECRTSTGREDDDESIAAIHPRSILGSPSSTAGAGEGLHRGTGRARLRPRGGPRRRAHPGNQAASYLEENVGALDVELTEEDLAVLDTVAPAAGRTLRRHVAGQPVTLSRRYVSTVPCCIARRRLSSGRSPQHRCNPVRSGTSHLAQRSAHSSSGESVVSSQGDAVFDPQRWFGHRWGSPSNMGADTGNQQFKGFV